MTHMPNGLVEISQMLGEPQAVVDGPIGVACVWEVDEAAEALVVARVSSETGALVSGLLRLGMRVGVWKTPTRSRTPPSSRLGFEA